jgi:hypothetical protein
MDTMKKYGNYLDKDNWIYILDGLWIGVKEIEALAW